MFYLTETRKIGRYILLLLVTLCLCLGNLGLASVVSAEEPHLATDMPAAKYTTIDELQGKRIGVRPGSIQEKYILENIKDPDLRHYANFTDMAIALTQDKIDAFTVSKVIFSKMQGKYPQLTCLDKPLVMAPYYIAVSKNAQGRHLQGQLNAYIKKISASGAKQALIDRWYKGDYSHYDLHYADLPAPRGTLILATPAIAEPYCFVYNNKITGLDMEIITGFCREYGYGLKVEIVEWAGALSGLETGKYQLGACSLAKSAEREKHVYFSDAYEYAPVAVIVQAKDQATVGKDSISKKIKDKFLATFIQEERWQLFAEGVKVTVILSLTAIVFGTLLGFVFCLLELSQQSLVSKAAMLLVKFLQGIPVVLLLMLLYYIVFASVQIDAVWVGCLGFTLIFAAFVADIFRSGILAVDQGQDEAGRALGMTYWQSFFLIVFPQAVYYSMPVYKSQMLTIIKATSVAGYIAINDLTKISDIVRSRTFDAFFPLLAATVFYFIFSYLATQMINIVASHILHSRPSTTELESQPQSKP